MNDFKISSLFSPPILLTILFLIATFYGASIPEDISRGFYTFSILMKDVLMMFLPVAISIYIANALKDFQKNTAFVILLIIIFEGISNTTAVWYAYACVNLGDFPFTLETPEQFSDLAPFFSISFLKPSFWSPDKGVLLGAFLGILLSYTKIGTLESFLSKSLLGVNFIMKNIFSRLVPFFAFGFLLNLAKSGLLEDITYNYTYVFSLLLGCLSIYLAFLFLLGAGFSPKKAWSNFINTVPSGMIAFTSMSSAATMPYTIAGAEKNLQNPKLAGMIIPATTNIQQVGDCLINAFMCLIILMSFGKPIPSLYEWTLFTGAFIVARYWTTAIAGGAIFIMLDIYQRYLGFAEQEISLILAMNIILDPFVTSSNVFGNGALAIILEKVLIMFGFAPKEQEKKLDKKKYATVSRH